MDMLLATLLGEVASAVITPYIVNSIGRVPRPRRVDVRRAMSEAHQCRPVVPYRAPRPYTEGRVKALFIGINYTGTSAQLSGCVNDVWHMLSTLQKIEFPISECCILVDDRNFPNCTALPTRENIIRHLAWLVYDVRPGDVLFLHFSGHGTETNGGRDSGEWVDQCLVPLDYQREGAILDDDLFDLIVRGLPAGVRMTAVFDCCHSASLLDLPFAFVAGRNVSFQNRHEMRMVRRDNHSRGDVVMFSGCEDSGTSADVSNTSSFGNGTGVPGGAATQAFTWALLNTRGYSYIDIFLKTREILHRKGYKQVPQLSSSKPVDLYKQFSLFGPITVNTSLMQYVPREYVVPWTVQPFSGDLQQWQQQQYHHAPQPSSSQPVVGVVVQQSGTSVHYAGPTQPVVPPGGAYPPAQYASVYQVPQQPAYYATPQQQQQTYYQPPTKETNVPQPGYPVSLCMKFAKGMPGRK